MEELWDKILFDHPNKTANYLHWIYESNNGRRSPQNALFDNLIDAFFPQHKSNLTKNDAEQIYKRLGDIEKDIINREERTGNREQAIGQQIGKDSAILARGTSLYTIRNSF